MELKGSKTEANLMAAFGGESQARNKYTFYASVAKREGYEQIAAFFQKTADNEKEHAEIWFRRHRRYSCKSPGRSSRRELRMDRDVRSVCQRG